MLCLLQFHSEFLFSIVLLCILYAVCICIISCIMSSPAEFAMSTSGIKISPLVPAEEIPHGRHQDWLLEYAGE